MHRAVQLYRALVFVYGIQSVLCCIEILYSTIQMFIGLQISRISHKTCIHETYTSFNSTKMEENNESNKEKKMSESSLL